MYIKYGLYLAQIKLFYHTTHDPNKKPKQKTQTKNPITHIWVMTYRLGTTGLEIHTHTPTHTHTHTHTYI